MTCMDSSSRFFRATFAMARVPDHVPVVEDEAQQGGCVAQSRDGFRMDLEGARMARCGVKGCQGAPGERRDMCVTLRVPTVKGLKLPEDLVVTLQCRPQDSVVAQTKQLRVNPFVM